MSNLINNKTFVLNGWWGKNFVLLSKNCDFYRLKIEFLDLLKVNKFEFEDDRQNLTPNINLYGSKSLYDKYNDTIIDLQLIKFVINKIH
jgi:hypothetical protein